MVDVITNVFADIRVSCFDDLIGSPKAKIEDIPIGLGLMGKKQITDRVHVYGGGGLSIHLLDGHRRMLLKRRGTASTRTTNRGSILHSNRVPVSRGRTRKIPRKRGGVIRRDFRSATHRPN